MIKGFIYQKVNMEFMLVNYREALNIYLKKLDWVNKHTAEIVCKWTVKGKTK